MAVNFTLPNILEGLFHHLAAAITGVVHIGQKIDRPDRGVSEQKNRVNELIIMKIFTIGFTKKSARVFFGKLRRPEIKRLVDVRLNNVSQLAGFTKKDDLRFFTEAICD